MPRRSNNQSPGPTPGENNNGFLGPPSIPWCFWHVILRLSDMRSGLQNQSGSFKRLQNAQFTFIREMIWLQWRTLNHPHYSQWSHKNFALVGNYQKDLISPLCDNECPLFTGPESVCIFALCITLATDWRLLQEIQGSWLHRSMSMSDFATKVSVWPEGDQHRLIRAAPTFSLVNRSKKKADEMSSLSCACHCY